MHLILDSHSIDIHRDASAPNPVESLEADSILIDVGLQRLVPITELIAVYRYAKSI